MAHQSLYRKYRPQGFDDVVGQSHITRTLQNAVAEDSVAHAYLFAGPRGTGKTTTARILAKALDCEKGPTPDPDLTCEQCIDIAEGRHPDVRELDAASHTGVESVREEIISRLQYATSRGRYKIYIIDEVHMLSISAFNALLKSIEEPPPHTVFILCTTHPHKIPETIRSRCQRFDFHRISVDDIVERLAYICEQEEISVAEGALMLIAKHAAGGMRDAISTLDQLATFTGKQLELADVEGLLGEVDSALLFEMASLIAARDIAGSFRFVATLAESGTDIGEFVRDLTAHMRDLYVTAAVGDATGIVDTTSERLSRLSGQASEFGEDRLARILDILGDLGSQMRWSSDPRLALEVALTRMARPQGDLTLEALAERIEALEAGVPIKLQETTPAAAEEQSRERPSSTEKTPAADEAAEPVVVEAPSLEMKKLDRAALKRAWPGILAEARKAKASRATFFANTEIDVDEDSVTAVVEFPSDAQFTMEQAQAPETRDLLDRAFGTVLGFRPPVRFQLGRGPVREAVDDEMLQEAEAADPSGGQEPLEEISSHVAVQGEDPEAPIGPESVEDVERVLMDELGARVIAEHTHSDGEEGTET